MVNTVQLVGRLTRDPALDRTSGGKPAVSLRVAVLWREREHADDVTIVAYDGLAETAARDLASGRQFGVVGRLHQAEWRSNADRRRERAEVAAAIESSTRHRLTADDCREDPRDEERRCRSSTRAGPLNRCY